MTDWSDIEDAPTTRDGAGWAGEIYGFCPVQGHGDVDSVHWYFRARWDMWSFDVYGSSCAEALPEEPPTWGTWGDYDNASWMKWSDAWKMIDTAIERYRSTQRQGKSDG